MFSWISRCPSPSVGFLHLEKFLHKVYTKHCLCISLQPHVCSWISRCAFPLPPVESKCGTMCAFWFYWKGGGETEREVVCNRIIIKHVKVSRVWRAPGPPSPARLSSGHQHILLGAYQNMVGTSKHPPTFFGGSGCVFWQKYWPFNI